MKLDNTNDFNEMIQSDLNEINNTNETTERVLAFK